MLISIVMPAYNEAALLEESVRDVVAGLHGLGLTFELHIVENGSTDGTQTVAARLAEQIPQVATHSMRAADYGEALRTGLLEASGDVGVIFDVDYYDLDFLKHALELIDPSESPVGPAVVVGSKRAPGARDDRSSLRRAATSVFSTILRRGFGLTLSDTHGMKVLNLLAFRDAVRACRSGADLFDTELIIRAEHSGLVTAEIPVTVTELRPSRTSIGRQPCRARSSVWPSSGSGSVARRVTSASSGNEVLASTSGEWLELEDGLVIGAGDRDAPASATMVGDVMFCPGFVELQVNGLGDVDFWLADADGWRRAGRRLLESGVTSYLPTLVSAPLDAYAAGLARVAAAREEAESGGLARIAGVHLEGPFLGAAPGAHPPELLGPVDLEWLLALLDTQPGLVRLVTIAPEADPGLAGTRALVERGVVVSIGHSRCSYEDARAAADAGATMVTHLFNGMGPLAHRAPGLPGAALDDDRLTPGLIADRVHVHPALLRLAANAKDCVLVTDAVAVDVRYGGQGVTARDGAAYLDDGTLTGSTLTMDQAVRNMIELVGAARAVKMATTTPAGVIGLDNYATRGVGGRADLVALDRTNHDVIGVWLEGERAYARP